MSLQDLLIALKYGTSHSGDWGHQGRPGKVGGSGGGGGHASLGFTGKPDLNALRSRAEAKSLLDKAPRVKAVELNKTYKFGDCSDDPCKALTAYTGGDYADINAVLRKPESAFGQYFDYVMDSVVPTIGNMDKAFETASTMPMTAKVTRNVYLNGKMESLINSLEVGDEFKDNGYVSTSIMDVPGSFVMDIIVPKGSKAIYVEQISNFPSERELLLARGAQFRVVDKNMAGGRMTLEYVGNDPTNVMEELNKLAQ